MWWVVAGVVLLIVVGGWAAWVEILPENDGDDIEPPMGI